MALKKESSLKDSRLIYLIKSYSSTSLSQYLDMGGDNTARRLFNSEARTLVNMAIGVTPIWIINISRQW